MASSNVVLPAPLTPPNRVIARMPELRGAGNGVRSKVCSPTKRQKSLSVTLFQNHSDRPEERRSSVVESSRKSKSWRLRSSS